MITIEEKVSLSSEVQVVEQEAEPGISVSQTEESKTEKLVPQGIVETEETTRVEMFNLISRMNSEASVGNMETQDKKEKEQEIEKMKEEAIEHLKGKQIMDMKKLNFQTDVDKLKANL